MYLMPFETFKVNPGKVTLLIHSHILVAGLCSRLAEEAKVLSTLIVVFSEKLREVCTVYLITSILEGQKVTHVRPVHTQTLHRLI